MEKKESVTSTTVELSNKRYIQLKEEFDSNRLDSRKDLNWSLAQCLLHYHPGLYKFKLLLLVTEIGEKLLNNELEMIAWTLVLKAYFSFLKTSEGVNFLSTKFLVLPAIYHKLSFSLPDDSAQLRPLWDNDRIERIFKMCGIF